MSRPAFIGLAAGWALAVVLLLITVLLARRLG
jgi:hypothetical protein